MSRPRCQHCATPLPTLARRHARFCSPRCRAASARARRGLPAELVSVDRWVRYSAAKVPLTVAGAAASVTNPAHWSPFAAVRGHDRIGLVLNGDGLACLDLDHCLERGRPLPWVRPILACLPATYIEVSPSGRGLHVWGRGRLARGRRLAVPGGTVECYSSGRYITVTGRPFAGSVPTLGDLSAVLADLGA